MMMGEPRTYAASAEHKHGVGNDEHLSALDESLVLSLFLSRLLSGLGNQLGSLFPRCIYMT